MRAAVIPFTGRVSRVGLSLRDRMEIAMWQPRLLHLGYDRVVVHERGPCDPPELESFLSLYRQGEAFARWGLTRKGESVVAWYSVTGADVGRFGSMEEAFATLFPEASGAVRHDWTGGQVIRAFC
jgi:hypothetical protein